MKSSFELNACASNSTTLSDLDLDGLDAVYLGQPYCVEYHGNFIAHPGSIGPAIAGLHGENTKAYLTTPAIPPSSSMPAIEDALREAAAAGIDAIETHDVGLFRWVRRELPDVRVHVGNFANTYNQDAAILWERLGAARAVPNHELTGDELTTITSSCEAMEFERPVHGPLPLGMAFACLLRRNNPEDSDGPCLQQCSDRHDLELDGWRMRSVGTSLLSGEDYCLIEHLPDLARRGLTAFRLETYFEPAAKINLLVSIYRDALDAVFDRRPSMNDIVIAERGIEAIRELCAHGLCNGWHFGRSGRDYVGAGDSCVR